MDNIFGNKVFSWMTGKSRQQQQQQQDIMSTRTTVYTPDSAHLLNSIPNLMNQLDPELDADLNL